MNTADFLAPIFNQIKTGAFLTTKVGNQINTMTIGWLTIGQVWGTELVTVYVRFSRYSYDIIQNSSYFTISFPYQGDKLDKIKEWGERSGRDYDKLKLCDIEATKVVNGVIIKDCNIHIECEKIYNQIMDPKALNPELLAHYYGNQQDYHHIYYGKILSIYNDNKLELFSVN